MSSDNEEDDLNYGINDQEAKSFGTHQGNHDDQDETRKNLDFSNTNQLESDNDDYCMPKYEKNPKIKPIEEDESNSNQEECGLEDLLNLIEQENDTEEKNENNDNEINERKKINLKKDKQKQQETSPVVSTQLKTTDESSDLKTKSSITITKLPKEESILTEKNTGVRVVKSSFKNDIDLNMRLACDYGKFLKLTDINRRAHELKETKDFKWFSIVLLVSKTESKCSAKGNNYVIWNLVDVTNLDKHQDISLFLFGNAYKSHWKSNEFEVFALIQPDILDNNQNSSSNNNTVNKQVNQTTGSFFNNNSPYNKKTTSNWNKFAAKKVDLKEKLSLSIRADHQLIPLGFSKDIAMCQSFKNESSNLDVSKRCKNLVNLQETPFCIYHCKQIDNKNKFGINTKGQYSMNKPTNRFGGANLFDSTSSSQSDFKFVPNPTNGIQRNQLLQKAVDLEQRAKASKELKAQILNSLNASIKDTSPIVAQVAVKTGKKSDLELLASLDGKQLDKEEIKKIRLAEQATVRHYSNQNNEAQKEIKKLFNSKMLLPNETTCNSSISSKRLHEYKQAQSQVLTHDSNGSPFEYSSKLREKYEENKKNFTLSTMGSHKDIVKQIKEKDTNKQVVETKPVIQPTTNVTNTNKSIIASDFLLKRVNEIKNANKPNQQENKNNIGFDLELYIGDSVTTKKLLDVESKYISHSAATATSTGYKRKLDELKQGSPSSPNNATASKLNESIEDKKAKKQKMIDEILSIKSNHLKEVNDPDKNPHLKAYFNKLEQQEMIDNKLSSVRQREVRAVTCKICSYTAFSQSDYCKKQNHIISRHMSIQRFFKCKLCPKRTYTLDKLYPTSSCPNHGEKFEPCSMKNEEISIGVKTDDNLNLESEMLLEAN